MKRVTEYLGVLCTVVLLQFSTNCNDGVNPVDLPRLELTVENVASKEVWLRVKFVNRVPPLEFAVERDGQQIAAYRMQKADTLVIDTTALPKRMYSYKAKQIEGTARTMASDAVQVMTLDTTSHAVQWQVDTLGVRGTIFDVWVFSKDSIWAVGEIFLKDSAGNEDPVLYNGSKWNGTRWQALRIPTRTFTGSIGSSRIQTIISFSEQDVWTFSIAGSYSHWDGSQWETQYVPERQGGGLKLWGTNPSNLFLVGTNGSISRFNGTSWQKMDSGTQVDLEDIWGIDEQHIWATGTSTSVGRSVLLAFNGNSWTIIYDTFNQPPATQFGLSSVWTNNPVALYVAGSSGVRLYSPENKTFRKANTSQTYVSYSIRANGGNDILVSGAGGELLHYNGSTWYLYPELRQSGGSAFAFWYSVLVRQDIVVIGGELFTGLFGVPVVIRGSR